MADDRIEIEVGGRPVSSSNPMPTTPGAGADIGGGKTLADVYAELVTLAGAKALSDVVTAVNALTSGGKTLADIDGHVDGLETLLAGGLPSALGASGGLKTEDQPAASGGLSIYRNLDVQTTGVRIKSGAGQIYWAWISNQAATVRFVKLYDTNTDPPTSAMTPVLTLAIPAASGGVAPIPKGLAFASGIGIRASSAVADNDATAPTANDVIVNLGYK